MESFSAEQRQSHCRRRPMHQSSWRYIFGGRRRDVRRASDRDATHMDWYPAPLLLATIATLLLSSADAALTLAMLEQGLMKEANPLMAYLMNLDVRLFINLKTALTAIFLVFLVFYSRVRLFGRTPVRHAVYWLCTFYALLVTYEVTVGIAFGTFSSQFGH